MSDWVSEWVSEWVWVSEWMSEWVSEWVSGWMSDWVSEWMSEWMSVCVSEWVNEWVSEWMSEWVSEEWMSEWVSVCEWVSEWVSEWGVNEWVSEWMSSEWVSEWVSGWVCVCARARARVVSVCVCVWCVSDWVKELCMQLNWIRLKTRWANQLIHWVSVCMGVGGLDHIHSPIFFVLFIYPKSLQSLSKMEKHRCWTSVVETSWPVKPGNISSCSHKCAGNNVVPEEVVRGGTAESRQLDKTHRQECWGV